jgi:hypothetical protein
MRVDPPPNPLPTWEGELRTIGQAQIGPTRKRDWSIYYLRLNTPNSPSRIGEGLGEGSHA